MAKALYVLDDQQQVTDMQRIKNIQAQLAGNEYQEKYWSDYGQLKMQGEIE
jgi:hypothetical protein